MKILLIGGSGHITNAIVEKFHKEGHRVYALSGAGLKDSRYSRVYEQYRFAYENNCIREVFESIDPDVTIFTGAYDNNFQWENDYSEFVKYTTGLFNVLSSYSLLGHGKFIYISSEEIYHITENGLHMMHEPKGIISREEQKLRSSAFKARALKSGEDICANFQITTDLDIINTRFDNICYRPGKPEDAIDICSKMCIEAVNSNVITFSDSKVSLIYLQDAIEALYQLSIVSEHESSSYRIDSGDFLDMEAMAEIIREKIGGDIQFNCVEKTEYIWVENNSVTDYDKEFPFRVFQTSEQCTVQIADYISRHASRFKDKEEIQGSLWREAKKQLKAAIRALIPFIENILCFVVFFMINNRTTDSAYFARVDFYLLYVLIFATIHGQQQATFSAVFSVVGYFFRQMYSRSGLDVALDYNTYVWIAQLFGLGVSVGYLRDKIKLMKGDKEDEISYLKNRLKDIEEINTINVKIKDTLQNQIINQSDSIGKIYEITSSLDKFAPEEVLFYAAEVVGRLMNSADVCIYTVSNRRYARLMSATSPNARQLGNSIQYTEYTEMYEKLKEKEVFINRKMLQDYPMMAVSIYSEEEIRLIIMVWDIPWEHMNLSQANRLRVIGYLVQNAMLRANKYMLALETQRFISGTRLMEAEAFRQIVNSFLHARRKGLTDCCLIRVSVNESIEVAGGKLIQVFRDSDYAGELGDGYVYILLANTNRKDSANVTDRITELGYKCKVIDDLGSKA